MARALPLLVLVALATALGLHTAARAQADAPLDALDPRQSVAAGLAAHAGKLVSGARLECDTEVCATRASVLDPLVQTPTDAALDPAAAAEAWSRLTRTELFRSVTPRVEPDPRSPGRVLLIFACVAHALVTDVDIEYVGARSFWYPKQFEAEIKKRLLVHKGAPYLLDDPEVLERQRQSVLELYERQGYEGTEVLIVPALEGDTGAARKRVRVKVLIREGAQDLLGEVLLQGNATRAYARALAPVETGERADFWRDFFQFIGVGTYERRKFRDELREVERRYREEGFFSARVRLDGVLEDRGRVYPMVRVFEGPHVELVFEGVRTQSVDALRAVTTFATAGAIDDTELAASKDEILRIYQAAAHYYARIATRREVLSPAQQRIVFSIDEGPQVYVESVEVRGPKRVRARTLLRAMETQGVGPGGVITALGASRAVLQDARLTTDLVAIQALYRERGYPGVRFRCMPEDEVPEVWEARGRVDPRADPLGRRAGRFDHWLDDPTRSRCFRVERAADARFVRVVIELTEGLRTTTDRLALESFLSAMTTETQDELFELTQRLGFTTRLRAWRKGVGVNRQKLASVEGFLLRWYRTQGYTYARVEATCGDQDAPDRPCAEATLYGRHIPIVRFKVETGPRTIVQGILLRGHLVTDDDVLEDELVFRRGAPLSTEDLFLSQANLRSLGIFDSVKVETIGADESVTSGEREVPTLVTVDVEESTYRLLDGSLGLRIDSAPLSSASLPVLYVVGAAVRDRNFLGRGLELGLEGEHGNRLSAPTDIAGDDARWLAGPFVRDRRFFGTRLSLELRALYNLGRTDARDQYEQGAKVETTLAYDFQNLSYPAQWGRGLGAQLTLAFERKRQRDLTRRGERPPFGEAFNQVSVEPSARWDRRDSPLHPTRGWLVSQVNEIRFSSNALVPSLLEPAFRETLTGEFVQSFFERQLILVPLVRLGAVQAANPSDEALRDFLFKAGGDGVAVPVRGYGEAAIDACDGDPSRAGCALAVDPDDASLARAVGGSALVGGSLEARFPSFLADDLWLAAFSDFAGVATRWRDLSADRFYPSVGGGVRWLITGQIPLRLDLAKPLRATTFSSTAPRAHLNIFYVF